MERVETLCLKLKEQIDKKLTVDQLLVTVQMLHSELMHIKTLNPEKNTSSSPAINIAPVFSNQENAVKDSEEKIVKVLQVDDAEVEAELEEIKRNADIRIQMSSHNKPDFRFDPIEDTPTMSQQQAKVWNNVDSSSSYNSNDSQDNQDSLNDKLKQSKTELSDTLQETAIKDLRKGIGLNDKFLFISELFRGDDVMYERSIKTINSFAILAEAEYWIRRELKLKLGWNESNPTVKQFDHLIRRRFS
ncbi:MAG: hypothetical protein ABIP69_01900 [Ferruginibacter sp.]